MPEIVCVIPARYNSARFPGKPLAMLRGKPMVRWVWEVAKRVRGIDTVIIATDDKRIFETAKGFGAEAVMTSTRCLSGTDRVAEAVHGLRCSFVVNLQGDEPLMPASVIEKTIAELVQDNSAVVSTPVVALPVSRSTGTAVIAIPVSRNTGPTTWKRMLQNPISGTTCSTTQKRMLQNPISGTSYSTTQKIMLQNPNFVKVVFDRNRHALYFSRSIVPNITHTGVSAMADGYIYKHIGLYVYRKKFLERFVRMPQSRLEKAEKLEQLRILENGFKIKVVVVSKDTIPVDTPQDLKRAERYLR